MSDVAIYFSREYGIGKISGRSMLYTSSDWDAAARMLENQNTPQQRSDGLHRRADTVDLEGISEKAFGSRPHDDAVAVRVAAGDCFLDGQLLGALPDGGYAVLRVEDALRVQCQQLLVVENLETFRYVGRYEWIPYGEYSTLAVFRGDTRVGSSDAAGAIAGHLSRILAFTDFDPAGLYIASPFSAISRIQSILIHHQSFLEVH